jgi:hypothetical protein
MSDLEAALDALQLGHFLPKLRQLGVDNLSQAWKWLKGIEIC